MSLTGNRWLNVTRAVVMVYLYVIVICCCIAIPLLGDVFVAYTGKVEGIFNDVVFDNLYSR